MKCKSLQQNRLLSIALPGLKKSQACDNTLDISIKYKPVFFKAKSGLASNFIGLF